MHFFREHLDNDVNSVLEEDLHGLFDFVRVVALDANDEGDNVVVKIGEVLLNGLCEVLVLLANPNGNVKPGLGVVELANVDLDEGEALSFLVVFFKDVIIICGELFLKLLHFFDVFKFGVDDLVHLLLHTILEILVEFVEGNLAITIGVDDIHNLLNLLWGKLYADIVS